MLSKLYWLIDLCWLLIINLLTWIWLLQQETPETRKLLWPLSSVSWCLKAEMEMGFMFLYFAEHLLKLYWDFFLTIKAIKWEVKLWNCIPNQMLNFVAFCFGSKLFIKSIIKVHLLTSLPIWTCYFLFPFHCTLSWA